ncbi:substrate-binding domain-containing protein [Microbacter sp. GSS18]|nr:substrate-binding domain-containing protein [Microbacter sp. GSS18]
MSTPSAIDERRAARAARRRRILIWTTAAVIVLMIASIGTLSVLIVRATSDEPIAFPDDQPADAAGAGPCTEVSVLSSFENAEMVAALAAGYNAEPRDVGGSCVTVTAEREKSGFAAEQAADGFSLTAMEQPTVWMPDASTWLAVARDMGAEDIVPASGESTAESNIVLAMPQPLAAAIGWEDEAPSWADVFTAAADENLWSDLGYPEWGSFKLGKTSPVAATSGEAAMFASYGTASGSIEGLSAATIADPEVTAAVTEQELSVSHYMSTPEHFLWHARQSEQAGSAADFLSAVIVDEKSVWDYNRGITSRDGATRIESEPPREKLVTIYPTDGFYVSDSPAVVLTGDWVSDVQAEAAADFLRYARTAQGQQLVRESGYRDLNGELDTSVLEVGALQAAPVGALEFPDSDVVAAVNEAFPDVRKRADVLFLIDTSGSMGDDINDNDTRLSAAQDAIELALDHFTAGDNVGLAAFAQGPGGALTPGIVAPVADISENRDDFLDALSALEAYGHTPLYEAVDEYAAQMAESATDDRINAIVLLSDGANYTPESPTIGAEEMLTHLEDLHHNSPVLVFTLAYGSDADVATLQSISGATGAHYYDATDPTKVKSVLGDLVTSF